MTYFDACEACGQTEYLVLDGLCHECQQKANRAAHGSKTLPRVTGITMADGRVMTHLATTREEVKRAKTFDVEAMDARQIEYTNRWLSTHRPQPLDRRKALMGWIRERVPRRSREDYYV